VASVDVSGYPTTRLVTSRRTPIAASLHDRYRTGTDRYSLEVKIVARKDLRDALDNPGVFVRDAGRPSMWAAERPSVKAKSFLRAFGV